jgi:glutamate-5-semialdehyde dehydrogenase
LPDPIGQVLSTYHAPNGLEIKRVRVPLGVVFFIYESRPNVTVDAAAICLKSGNAVILRGGKEAANSSNALIEILAEVGDEVGIPAHAVQLVHTPDREAVRHFLALSKYIDLAIPRGGESLIRHVVAHAQMPVLKHFEGNCHVYVDEHADLEKAERIVINAKCQRPGVCNACESLLVHEKIAGQFIPRICQLLDEQKVEMVGDESTCRLDSRVQPASERDYATEFLDLKISICQVGDLEEAIEHINRYGSGHTDAIVTEDQQAAERFCAAVDSSAVMVNASTRFNDGGEFGLGAEIGISTDKFHARGPCGINELTTYKYLCLGTGQIR